MKKINKYYLFSAVLIFFLNFTLPGAIGSENINFNIKANSDSRSIFKYSMHSLPSELEASIGTSTLFAAWNAATYVGQIDEQRLETAMRSVDYLSITQKALKKYGGLWFNDESYTISKKND